jgi:hypothetical protein
MCIAVLTLNWRVEKLPRYPFLIESPETKRNIPSCEGVMELDVVPRQPAQPLVSQSQAAVHPDQVSSSAHSTAATSSYS